MATHSSILKSFKLANTLPAVAVGSISVGLQVAGMNPFEGSLVELPTPKDQQITQEPETDPPPVINGQVANQKSQAQQNADPNEFLSQFVAINSGFDVTPPPAPSASGDKSAASEFVQPNDVQSAMAEESSENSESESASASSQAGSVSSTPGQKNTAQSSGGGGSDSDSLASSTSSMLSASTDSPDDTATDNSGVTDDTNTLVDGGQIFISNGEELYLQGTSFNDTLIGDTNGTDILIGGEGDDVYIVSSSNQSLIEDAGGGTDTVVTSVSGLGAYRGIEILQVDDQSSSYSSSLNVHPFSEGSSTSFELNGGFDTQTIIGGQGSDILFSNGASTLMGGSGDDVYVYSGSELVIENSDSGLDTVLTYASLTLPDNVEYVVTKSDSDISIVGNGLSNILIGNASDNLLSGGAGNDTLVSFDGEDELIGGTGVDTFILSTNEIAYITDYEPGEAIIFALNEPPSSISQVDAFTPSGSSDAVEWIYADNNLQIDWNGDGSSDSMVIFGTDTSASDLELSVTSTFTSIL
jgi:hypothetical protein